MSGIRIFEADVVGKDFFLVSILHVKKSERFFRVFRSIKRQRRFVTRIAMPVRMLRVLFLNVSTVAKNVLRNVQRGRRTPDLPAEASLNELRKVAGVVQMRVRQDDIRDVRNLDRRWIPVHLAQRAPALEQAAINQEAAMRRGPQKIFRAGYLTGGA